MCGRRNPLTVAHPVRLQRWADDGFYVWKYELPTSPWFYVGAGGLVVLVLLLCLFPLAPYQVIHAAWEGSDFCQRLTCRVPPWE